MVYCSEHSIIKRLRYLLFGFKPFDRSIVELCRTCEVILQSCRGKHGILDPGYILLRLDNIRKRSSLHASELDDRPFERHTEMILQLLYVPALLARLEAFCPRVDKHPDLLGTRYHPVEVISPYGILVLICRHSEALSQLRRDE